MIFKAGDIFVSTSLSPRSGGGDRMYCYDGVTHALKNSWRGSWNSWDGASSDPMGNLWVFHWVDDTIEKWDSTGAQLWVKNTGSGTRPESVQFDRSGYAYVACSDGKVLQKWDTNGNKVATYSLAKDYRGVDHVDLHPDGHTLYYTSEGEHIKRWDIKSNTQLSDFCAIPGNTGGYAFALRRVPADGSYIVAVSWGDIHPETNNCWVSRIAANGSWMRDYVQAGYESHFGIDMDADGQHFWVGCSPISGAAHGTAVKVNLASGAVVATLDTGVAMDSVDGVTINVVKVKMPMLKVS